jgi:hypothetical protein
VGGYLGRLVVGAKLETAVSQQNRHVTGGSAVTVVGSWKEASPLAGVTVGVLARQTIAGAYNIRTKQYSMKASSLKESYAARTITAGGKRGEKFGGNAEYKVTGAGTIQGGPMMVFAAKESLELKVGGVTVTIKPDEITVDGKLESLAETVVTGDEKDT